DRGSSSSSHHHQIKKTWTKDSVVEAFANKTLFFVDAKKVGEDKVYQVIVLDFDSNAVATYNDGDQEVKVEIYADKYGEDIFPYLEMGRGNFSESSLMDRETERYVDFNFYDEFDNDQLFYRNFEDAKKRLEELQKKDADISSVTNPTPSDDTQSAPSSVGTDDNSSASVTQDNEQTNDMYSRYPGSFIYFQDNKYLKFIAFHEGTAYLELTDGSSIEGKWNIENNNMFIENIDEEFRLYLYPSNKDFKNGPGSFSHDDDIELLIYYHGDIMNDSYKDKQNVKIDGIGY
ncbi:MAG: hypothetical protein DSZ06_00850, partial [Sulfurospirillum sp.]